MASQTYTFATARGATNFARLELINGARYMKGTATIGSGGSMLASNGVNMVSNLTLQSGSTLQVALTPGAPPPLVVEGVLQLGGSTLAVTLNGAPTAGTVYPLVSNVFAQASLGSFANTAVIGTYSNTSYALFVQTVPGAGGGINVKYKVLSKATALIAQ